FLIGDHGGRERKTWQSSCRCQDRSFLSIDYVKKAIGGLDMNEPIINTQAQARSYLEKAETYTKLGLRAQVQYELEQARRVDPYIVEGLRYKTLLEANATAAKKVEDLKMPLRVGAGMLFVNALLGAIFLIIILTTGGGGNLGGSDIVAPIVDIIIAVNL